MLAPRPRKLRAAALGAAALLAAPALMASSQAASTASGAGSSASTVTLVKLTSGAASVRALTATLATSTMKSPGSATISVVPIWTSASGAVGAVEVTPASSPKHVGAGTVSLPSNLASVAGPAVDVVASLGDGAPVASIAANALGSISVLGAPLALGTGTVDVTSKVTKTAASSTKSIELSSLALPSVLDMLRSLGLDLSALTQGQLNALANVVLSTVSSTLKTAVATANSAVDSAQAAMTGAADSLSGAQAQLTAAKAQLSAAQANLTAAQSAASAAMAAVTSALAPLNAVTAGPTSVQKTALAAAGVSGVIDANSWQALDATAQHAVGTVLGAGVESTINTAIAALNAVPAVSTAQAAVATANALVDQVQALVDSLVALLTAIRDALDADPLAALGSISAGTSAVAGSKATADGHLSVGSVEVLGAGVLPSDLTAALGAVTTALSGALNSIAGVTFTAPKIEVGAVTKSADTVGKTSSAAVSVAGLKVTLPTISLPQTLALPGAGALPGLDVVNGVLSSAAGSITIAELTDSAQFTQGAVPATTPNKPATPAKPTAPKPTGSLPTTGAPAALGIVALLAIAGAVALRRRTVGSIDG